MALTLGTRMHSSEEINSSTATGIPRVEAPLTTATITLGADDTVLFVNPAGTIAALTIKLPPIAGRQNGTVCRISFSQIVTALTVQDSAAGAVESTAGAVSVAHEYRYVNSTLGWVRWA
jgi:hypothetical protein